LGSTSADINNTFKKGTISYTKSNYVTQTSWVRGQGRIGKTEGPIASLLRDGKEEEEEEFLNCTTLIDRMVIELNHDITYLARESNMLSSNIHTIC
jgi:hypothetical protein